MPKKAVIFDLDGVLVDTGHYHKQSWYDLTEREGWEYSDQQFYDTFGMTNAEILPRLSDRCLSPEEIEEMSQWKEQRYRELIAGQLTFLDGVRELLEDLRRHRYLLAVGTSTPRVNLDFMLDATGAHDMFDATVSSEDVTRSKPAPDTFVTAAKRLGVPNGRCIVVEDAIPGVQAAKAGGMAVIAVTTTRRRHELQQADKVVDGLGELTAADFDQLLGE